jgi:hypothetical protein
MMDAVLDRLNEKRRLRRQAIGSLRALKTEAIAAMADLDHDERLETFEADRLLEKATRITVALITAQGLCREIRELEKALGSAER